MRNGFGILLAIAAAISMTTGCATKRYVQETVTPIDRKVGDLDKRNAESAQSIKDLDEKTQRDISRVEEKAGAADSRAAEASRQAAEASGKAAGAIEKADSARTLAENGIARAGQLEKVVASLDDYRVAATKTVYFARNSSRLQEEAHSDLDELARSLGNSKRYLIEVQGFTDSSGGRDYNYSLSTRRAASVARYLSTQHKIPVYRIRTLGMGGDSPVESETTPVGRTRSRRVEVRLLTTSSPN